MNSQGILLWRCHLFQRRKEDKEENKEKAISREGAKPRSREDFELGGQ
jgi:hypothetical protein